MGSLKQCWQIRYEKVKQGHVLSHVKHYMKSIFIYAFSINELDQIVIASGCTLLTSKDMPKREERLGYSPRSRW